jgi:hypothetical protein
LVDVRVLVHHDVLELLRQPLVPCGSRCTCRSPRR